MRFLGVVLLLLAPGLASAQVYKCKDPKTGRVTYTQTKPKDADCSGGPAAPAAPEPAAGSSDALKKFGEEIDKSRAEEATAKQKAEQQQAQKASRCTQARARLDALERASKVYSVDEKGERQYNSAQQNDAMREQARQSVATECT